MISYNYLDYYFMVTWTTINPISEMRKQHDQVMKGRAYSAFLVRYLYMILCTFPNTLMHFLYLRCLFPVLFT